MKQILYLVLLYVGGLSSYAQRLNEQGLNMVKEFTVQEYSKGQPSKGTKYVFGYDDENRMTSLEIITNGCVSESYMKKIMR